MTSEFIRVKSLLAEYKNALNWLKSLNIDYTVSRFGKYEKDLDRFGKFTFSDQIKNAKDKKFIDSYDSALEAHDLITIHKGLKGIVDQNIIKRLESFVSGPVHAVDEKSDGRSHIARNIGFELLIASHYVLAGYEIDSHADSDVEVIDKDNHFHIECKRPSKESTLKSNLDKAYSQLKRRYANFGESYLNRGFVVISIGKIVNPENRVLGVKVGSEILDVMNDVVTGFLNRNRSIWKRNLHEKTTAVFAYLQMAANAKDYPGIFIVSHYGGLYLRPGHLSNIKDLDLDRLYFSDIISRLNNGVRKAFEDRSIIVR